MSKCVDNILQHMNISDFSNCTVQKIEIKYWHGNRRLNFLFKYQIQSRHYLPIFLSLSNNLLFTSNIAHLH